MHRASTVTLGKAVQSLKRAEPEPTCTSMPETKLVPVIFTMRVPPFSITLGSLFGKIVETVAAAAEIDQLIGMINVGFAALGAVSVMDADKKEPGTALSKAP